MGMLCRAFSITVGVWTCGTGSQPSTLSECPYQRERNSATCQQSGRCRSSSRTGCQPYPASITAARVRFRTKRFRTSSTARSRRVGISGSMTGPGADSRRCREVQYHVPAFRSSSITFPEFLSSANLSGVWPSSFRTSISAPASSRAWRFSSYG